MHDSNVAGLSAAAIQAGSSTCQTAEHSHGHTTHHNSITVAIHQSAPSARQPRERVYQFGQVFAADIRMRSDPLLGHTQQASHALHAARSDHHQSHGQH